MGCVDNAEEGFWPKRQEEKGSGLATPCADTSIHHKLLYSYYIACFLLLLRDPIRDGGSANKLRRRGKLRRFVFAPDDLSLPLHSPLRPATDRGYVADRITLRDVHPRFILVLSETRLIETPSLV